MPENEKQAPTRVADRQIVKDWLGGQTYSLGGEATIKVDNEFLSMLDALNRLLADPEEPAQPAVQNLAEELRRRILAPQPNGWDATTQVWAEASKMAFNQAADALDNLLPPEVWEAIADLREDLGRQPADPDSRESRWYDAVNRLLARLYPPHLGEQGGSNE